MDVDFGGGSGGGSGSGSGGFSPSRKTAVLVALGLEQSRSGQVS
jgi:hypothetical protein